MGPSLCPPSEKRQPAGVAHNTDYIGQRKRRPDANRRRRRGCPRPAGRM